MRADSPLIRTIELKDRNGRVTGTKEVVTYQGLLSKAHDEGLKKIATTLIQAPSEANREVAIVRAEVETSKGLFQGYGDASPGNVNTFIVPHLIRMAETRAKARALRDAVNVGIVSREELIGEEDLGVGNGAGSGADNDARRPRQPRSGPTSPRPVPPRPQPPANGTATLMSEAQRRYLFRLLAGQGVQGEAAHAYLRSHFGVESLASVTRTAAATLIDDLVAGRQPQENGHGPGVLH
jgi:hypothetical protein